MPNEYRVQETSPVDGKPAWVGQYRAIGKPMNWATAASQYGPICYASVEAALAGVTVYAAEQQARIAAGGGDLSEADKAALIGEE